MRVRQTSAEARSQRLPRLWLLSDERNDAVLEQALRALPRGSGFVFRHYHLATDARRLRWRKLRRIAAARGHVVVLAGSAALAREWGADGVYGGATTPRLSPGLMQIATAHGLRELASARRGGADAVMLSPVFSTRSHPGAATLGPVRFRLIAARSDLPVIALGGMTPATARRLRWVHWAAIDGLSTAPGRRSKA